ncbi:MAG: 7-dehydrocholesterol reductase [Chlamydiae bacterium]|nr:7-dehydrocholesterol reductase [Chlamydiota bacterium]
MSQVDSKSLLVQFGKRTLMPLLLITCCPSIVILIWYTNVYLSGSLALLYSMCVSQGFFSALYQMWGPVFWGSSVSWFAITVFTVVQLLIMRFTPGKKFYGPITPKGNVPVYKANGPQAFFISLGLFYICSFKMGLFSPTIIYDHFGEILSSLNLLSLFLCVVLYFKGRYLPSSADAGSSDNPIFDYYWGTELYPRFLGWDIKKFVNCRFGLVAWSLIVISFAAKQHELYGLSDAMLLVVMLQLIYLIKFFAWETGYLGSLDIMHNKTGFYICWGSMVWLPAIYPSSTLYLVNHPQHLGFPTFSVIFLLGFASILLTYFADRQRQQVRVMNGECRVWKKEPQLIIANYTTQTGEQKQSLLLASGFWGIARHFHYIPEFCGAFFWSVPVLFHSFLPYFYIVFLAVLMVERSFRDDARCAAKYGEDWKKYCQKVPYKIVPYMF